LKLTEEVGKGVSPNHHFVMSFENTDFGLFRYFPEPAFVMDPEGTLLDCNEVFAARFPASGPDIRGCNVYELLASVHRAPEVAASRKAKADEVLRTGRHIFFDDEKDGRHWRHFVHPVATPEGRITRLLVIVHDVTKAKQEEFRSRKDNLVFKALLDATPGSVIILDAEGRMTGFNRYAMQVFGKSEAELHGSDPFEIVHPEDRPVVWNKFKAVLEKNIEEAVEAKICMHGNREHTRWFIVHARKTEIDGVPFVVTVGLDIDERKQMEVELKRSHDRLDFTLAKTHLGWWEFDPVTNTTIRTLEHDRIFGYDTLLPEWDFNLFLDHVINEDRTMVEALSLQALDRHENFTFECRIRRKDGAIRWIWVAGGFQVDARTHRSLMSGIVRDISERKGQAERHEALQLELQQAQKMEAIGQLAGGIAHDFNNALTAILGNADLLVKKVPPASRFIEHIDDIRKSALRSANMTRQLLAFARKEIVMPRVCSLDEEIEHMLPMIKSLIGTHIAFLWRPSGSGRCVHMDPSQIDQILINLCINARDAINGNVNGNGTIIIETSAVTIGSEACAAGHTCQTPGEYLQITICDTGCGIEALVLPHIYEPFFTTKEPGKGTGLGLSTVYGILKQNKGWIDCKTRSGEGTTFNLYLPTYNDSAVYLREEHGETDIDISGETILLVEDAPNILPILQELLEKRGFRIVTARDAESAVQAASQHSGDIDLLVTDIMLPDMNGIELSKKMEAARPGIKTLFMSGYVQENFYQHKNLGSEVNFIQKPFNINSFLRMVSKILASSRN
jgi:two-component system, cell cycle sensor histidine kinase and response regulator CckA